MPTIQTHLEVKAPIGRVFDLSRSVGFHLQSNAYSKETVIAGRSSGLFQAGDTVTWRAKHLGIRQNLTSRIVSMDRPHFFSDEQVKGAFRHFHHQHHFREKNGLTIVDETFEFSSPLGPLGHLANFLFLTRYMRNFLETRNSALKKIAESNQWRTFPGMQDH